MRKLLFILSFSSLAGFGQIPWGSPSAGSVAGSDKTIIQQGSITKTATVNQLRGNPVYSNHIDSASRKGDLLYNIVDVYNGEPVTYVKTTLWYDGVTAMDDSKVDNVIYKKRGTEYFVDAVFQKTGVIKLSRFGQQGSDGFYLDTTLQRAANSVTRALDCGEAKIDIETRVTWTHGVHIIGRPYIKFKATTPNDGAIRFDFPFLAQTTISSFTNINYNPISTSSYGTAITVASSSSFLKGDIVLITSNDYYLFGGTAYKGELMKILEVIDGTTIYLSGEISDTYTTTPKLTLLNRDQVIIDDIDITETTNNYTATSSSYNGSIRFVGCVNPQIKNGYFHELRATAINMTSCWSPEVHARAKNLRDKVAIGSPFFGYLVQCYGATRYGKYYLTGEKCRHVYTTEVYNTLPSVDPNNTKIFYYGTVREDQIINSVGINTTNAAFDTHPGSHRIKFINCTSIRQQQDADAQGSTSPHFQDRSCDTEYHNCAAIGSGVGFYLNSGDVDHEKESKGILRNCSVTGIYGLTSNQVVTFKENVSTYKVEYALYNCKFENGIIGWDNDAANARFYGGEWKNIRSVLMGKRTKAWIFDVVRTHDISSSSVDPIRLADSCNLVIKNYYVESLQSSIRDGALISTNNTGVTYCEVDYDNLSADRALATPIRYDARYDTLPNVPPTMVVRVLNPYDVTNTVSTIGANTIYMDRNEFVNRGNINADATFTIMKPQAGKTSTIKTYNSNGAASVKISVVDENGTTPYKFCSKDNVIPKLRHAVIKAWYDGTNKFWTMDVQGIDTANAVTTSTFNMDRGNVQSISNKTTSTVFTLQRNTNLRTVIANIKNTHATNTITVSFVDGTSGNPAPIAIGDTSILAGQTAQIFITYTGTNTYWFLHTKNNYITLSDVYFPIVCTSASTSFSAVTNYYVGSIAYGEPASNTVNTRIMQIPFNATLVGASISTSNGTPGSAETSTVNMRLNNTTDVLLSNTVAFNAANTNQYTAALDTNVTAGDTYEIKLTTGAFTSAPVNSYLSVILYFKRR